MLKKIGKKGREWLKARKLLVKELEKTGEYRIEGTRVYGNCKDCGHHHPTPLQPDHKIKRSQGGKHTKKNIDWICNYPPCMCHDKRDNQGDPMSKKPKSKKADWQRPHKCKRCKVITSTYLCHNCGEVSV